MNNKKIYLTQKGFEDLKKEFNDIQNKRRPEVVERLSAAREMGDLSENAEYTAAREELSFIDGRLEELEGILRQVEIIADGNHKTQSVDLGSQVIVKISDREETFTVVGEWEADPTEKKISHESPLGKALLGKAVGAEIEVEAPAGKMVYKIVSIN
ncbi:MAG: transcription elongation factor GreA [Candidatus Levyibacteriota bacterium]